MSPKRLIPGFRWSGTLGAVALMLSACGGGGGGGIVPGGVVGDCTSISGTPGGYSMGLCATATANGLVLESALQPVDAVVSVAPGGTSYTLDLRSYPDADLGVHTFDHPADESLLNTLGDVQGVRFEKVYAAGTYAAVGDFSDARDRNTGASMWGAAGGLSYTNFGFWERFVSASEGYAGGWYGARSPADANPSLPTSGSATYTGVAVGGLAPVKGNPPVYGLSADLSLTAYFATGSVTGSMSNFALSTSLGANPANIADVSLTGSIAGSGFTGAIATAGGEAGNFEGAFFGPQPAGKTGPAEVGGRFQFVTPDARQVVGAFGGRQ